MAIANIAAAAAAGGSTSAPARDVAEESGGDEFSGAIAAAETVAAQAGQKPVAGIPQQQEGETKVAQAGGVQAQATGRIDRAIPQQAGGSSENASLIQKMAVSSNTGVDIAGLKPWSPDWVFEGGMNRNPAQKTLIGDQAGGGSADASEGLEQLLRQSGAIMADSPDERIATAPGLPDSASMKGVAARTLGGDDFISVRQASAPRGQVPSAIGAQIGHAGRKGSTKLIWEGIDEPLASGNWPLIGPSAVPYSAANQVPREMTREDMERELAAFVRGAYAG